MHRSARNTILGALLALAAGVVSPPGASAAFPGANGPIVFQTFKGEIYSIGPEGEGLRLLVEENASASNYHPAVSADGRTVAFSRYAVAGGDDLPIELFTVPISGGAISSLGLLGTQPAFDPSGQRLAFMGYYAARRVLTAGIGGTDKRKVARGSDTPTFSPDGQVIAFNGASEVVRVKVDGSGRRRLTDTDGGASGDPSFSPEGKTIAFSRFDESSGENSAIWTMRRNGEHAKRLTPESKNSYDPAFSPDGTKIVFTRTVGKHGGKTRLFVIDRDGSGAHPITEKSLEAEAPDWAPR